jgi:hypothetical protein
MISGSPPVGTATSSRNRHVFKKPPRLQEKGTEACDLDPLFPSADLIHLAELRGPRPRVSRPHPYFAKATWKSAESVARNGVHATCPHSIRPQRGDEAGPLYGAAIQQ